MSYERLSVRSEADVKILAYLYDNDESYPLKMARDLKMAKKTVYPTLTRLKERGLLAERVEGRMKFYKLTEIGRGLIYVLLSPNSVVALYGASTLPPEDTACAKGRAKLGMDRFLTGHEVFDEIIKIQYGSAILMLDETFMEARKLMMTLLKEKEIFEIVSYALTTHGSKGRTTAVKKERIVSINNVPLSDVSVVVDGLRAKAKGGVIIHSYIPDFIIRYEPEAFLRLLETWCDSIVNHKTVEFYLLPKDAFPDEEKKIMSIVDGVIVVRVARSKEGFNLSFVPMRCCKPEWHLHEFRYKIEDSKVLIEWKGKFTDRLYLVA